ncbi:Heat induced stress protein YflT [compost metagenome]
MKKIVGVFASEQDASNAIEDLKRYGYSMNDISIVGRNTDDVASIEADTGTKAPEGIASGAATGGLVGGITGLLAGLGALAIPGIGPIVAAGPIAAALTGAVVGAGAGGLVGGLIGLGIPENEAKEYGSFVEQGRILVLVDGNESQQNEIYRVFQNNRALNSHQFGLTDANRANAAVHRETGTNSRIEKRETAGTFYQEIPPPSDKENFNSSQIGNESSGNEQDEHTDINNYRRQRDARTDRRPW